MSDTMTSGEIEDVLSSIRRLVTEDLKPHARLDLSASAPSPEPAKLMLTPALRVGEGPGPLVLGQPVAARPGPTDPPEPAARLDGVVATIGAAVEALPETWESETGDASITGLAFASTRARTAAPSAPDPWDEPEDADGRADAVEAAPAAEEADAAAPDDAEAAFVHRTAMDRAEAAALAEIAETEAADAAVDWDDAVDVPPGAAFQVGGDDSLTDPDMDDLDAEMPQIDEAMLRDLVRDVLREELQGPLGERITRNIRKLVRAEVNRALTTRDLD